MHSATPSEDVVPAIRAPVRVGRRPGHTVNACLLHVAFGKGSLPHEGRAGSSPAPCIFAAAPYRFGAGFRTMSCRRSTRLFRSAFIAHEIRSEMRGGKRRE